MLITTELGRRKFEFRSTLKTNKIFLSISFCESKLTLGVGWDLVFPLNMAYLKQYMWNVTSYDSSKDFSCFELNIDAYLNAYGQHVLLCFFGSIYFTWKVIFWKLNFLFPALLQYVYPFSHLIPKNHKERNPFQKLSGWKFCFPLHAYFKIRSTDKCPQDRGIVHRQNYSRSVPFSLTITLPKFERPHILWSRDNLGR